MGRSDKGGFGSGLGESENLLRTSKGRYSANDKHEGLEASVISNTLESTRIKKKKENVGNLVLQYYK